MSNSLTRLLLPLACLTLLPLAGCAPDAAERDVAAIEGARDPGEDIADPATIRAPSMEVTGEIADGALPAARASSSVRAILDDAVAAAANEHGASAGLLPSVKVFSPNELGVAVHRLLARSAGLDWQDVVVIDQAACADGDDSDCPKRFLSAVARHNPAFARAIAPAVRRLPASVTDLHVATWRFSHGDGTTSEAITLRGRLGDHLLAVVFYP